jgi:hypothetical protein
MKTRASVALTGFAATVFLLWGCTSTKESSSPPSKYPLAKKSYPYVLWVHTFAGAAGVGLDYYLTYESIVVATHNDWGKPPREVYNRALTQQEQTRWRAFIDSFPWGGLEDVYEDIGTVDGLDVYFTFSLKGQGKEIALRNTRQNDLFELCDEIDRLVPEERRLNIAEHMR